ncbi:MAG: glycosyltransferase family 2 protein [Paracoccaceae bacterium]
MSDAPTLPKWAVVSTIKAEAEDILKFAAHHLDLGAHRLFLYLDAPNPEAEAILKAHPKVRVTVTDDAYWTRAGARPEKHQVRQTANVMHAYKKKGHEVDFITHIDVDEFLNPARDLGAQLADLPQSATCARVWPVEALSSEGQEPPEGITWFKSCARERPLRLKQTAKLYPTYGSYLNGGYLSHAMGKLFIRTGIEGLKIRIHNVFLGQETNPGLVVMDETELCHLHAKSWEDFIAAFRYRHAQGSYRDELSANTAKDGTGLNLHQLFATIMESEGEAGLRSFYNEVCLATPQLRAALERKGHLRSIALDLPAKRARHFPAAV